VAPVAWGAVRATVVLVGARISFAFFPERRGDCRYSCMAMPQGDAVCLVLLRASFAL